jgi:hypothetical protein
MPIQTGTSPRILRNLKLQDLAPPAINYDAQVQAACQAFDPEMYQIIDATPAVIFISNILQLADSNLVDILAWQFHVDFYDPSKPLDFRKNLVANSIQWHMRKGTVQLLQDVLDTFWPGGATIQEWWQYMDPLPPNFPTVDTDEWRLDFRPADVNPAQDRFQINNAPLAEGEMIFFQVVAGSTLPAPLVAGTTYYVVNYSASKFQVSATSGGSPVNLTSSGSGDHSEIWHKASGTGSWHDRYRFQATIDETIIKPEDEAQVVALIDAYKPVSRWFDGFVRATVSECDIGWYGGDLRFVDRTSEAPDYTSSSGPQLGYGLGYLYPSYRDSGHKPDPSTDLVISTPDDNCSYVLWRQTTALIEGVGQGIYDWTYLRNAIAISTAGGKNYALQNLSGQYSPQWFFDAHPEEILMVSVKQPPPPQPAVPPFPTTVPFGPAWQAWYHQHQIDTAAQFKGDFHLIYVVASGLGNASESFLVKQLSDEVAANNLAIALGYTDTHGFGGTNGVLRSAWVDAAKWQIDMMVAVWAPIPIVIVSGPPYPTNGMDDLLWAFNYGLTTYGKLFGGRTDGATNGTPNPTDPVQSVLNSMSPTCPATGAQSHNGMDGQDTNPPTMLQQQLTLSCGTNKSNYFEVWQQDMADGLTNPAVAAVLKQWNDFLRAKVIGIGFGT